MRTIMPTTLRVIAQCERQENEGDRCSNQQKPDYVELLGDRDDTSKVGDLGTAASGRATPNFLALRSAQRRVTINGLRETGIRMANIPSEIIQ